MRVRFGHFPARLAAPLAAGLLLVAAAAPTTSSIDGFTIDWQGEEQTPVMVRSLTEQIKAVEDAPVSPEAAAFFRSQVVTVEKPGVRNPSGSPARAGPRGVFFDRVTNPPDNPVLLHELLHRWQFVKMPDGVQNADIRRFYQQAKASGKWPAESYMLKNPMEFWAMTASTVLHGRTARPPFTREAVKVNAPDLYAFIVKAFGYHGP